ncbi:MAG: class I SAM-dependent methyltransferase [Gemmatimonadota bacterium]
MNRDSTYWESRQETLPELQAVGYRSRSAGFNRWMYRARVRTTRGVVPRLLATGLPRSGARILDVGAGRGFWVEFWSRELESPRIWGVDVAPAAVEALRARFPEHRFAVADASSPGALPEVAGGFHLVQAYDVLYHITDDRRFRQTLRALGSAVCPGGLLLVTDNFPSEDVSTRPHVRLRAPESYERELPGFQLVADVPQYLLLNVPSGIRRPWLRWPAVLAWEGATTPARWDPMGTALGAILYGLDVALLPVLGRWSPSTRLRVYRKGSAEREVVSV